MIMLEQLAIASCWGFEQKIIQTKFIDYVQNLHIALLTVFCMRYKNN